MAFISIVLLVLVGIMIMGSSFLSAAETSVTAASKAKLHQQAKSGNLKALLAKELQQHMGLTLSAILLCNTLLITFATSTVTDVLTDLVGKEGVIYAPIITSALIVVYVETLPKIIAVNSPDRVLLSITRPIYWIYRFFKPITKIANLIARAHLALFGFKSKGDEHEYASAEELRGIIDLHKGPGQDVIHERAMLKSILDLGTVHVDEIMVHRKNVTMIDADDTPTQIVEQVLESPFTRIPLFKDNPDNIVGIVNAKALLRAVRAHPGDIDELNIQEITSKPWFVPENTDLLDQLHAFRNRREHFAVVVDEYGSFKGIVTLEDILEEIVGDISDEHDIAVRGIRPQDDGSYIVDGTVTIRDINRQLEWDLPDEEASTIAGLILYQIRMIPEVGQTFTFEGYRFEILRRHRNQITLLRITPPKDQETSELSNP